MTRHMFVDMAFSVCLWVSASACVCVCVWCPKRLSCSVDSWRKIVSSRTHPCLLAPIWWHLESINMTTKGNIVRTKSHIYYIGLHDMDFCPISPLLKFPPSGSREVSGSRVLQSCQDKIALLFLFIHYSACVEDVWDYTKTEITFPLLVSSLRHDSCSGCNMWILNSHAEQMPATCAISGGE